MRQYAAASNAAEINCGSNRDHPATSSECEG